MALLPIDRKILSTEYRKRCFWSKDVLVDKAIEHTRLSIDNVFVKAMKAFYEVIVRLINALAVLCIKRMGEILAGIFLKSVDSF